MSKVPSRLTPEEYLAHERTSEPRFEDEELDTLLDPVLNAEILSPSTEDCDRGRKFAHYRTLDSLRTYLVIAQDRVHVERYERQDDGSWRLTETGDPEAVLELLAIGARIPVGRIYERVEL